MNSLSNFASLKLFCNNPKSCDFEIQLNIPMNYSRIIEQFISKTFNNINEFKCVDNGISKQINLECLDNSVSIIISDSKNILINNTSHPNGTEQFNMFYESFTDFKNKLKTVSDSIRNGKKTETQEME